MIGLDSGRATARGDSAARARTDSAESGPPAATLAAGTARGRESSTRTARPAGTARVTPTSRGGTGTLVVNAPADAEVYVEGDLVGRGAFHSQPMPAGRYVVRATVGGLPGCASADTAVTVDLTANARRAISLQPVACGRLLLEIAAANTPHYTLVPIRGGATHEGVLPLPQPLVLPDGTYRLTVEASACAPYNDTLPVVAGKTRREAHALICQ